MNVSEMWERRVSSCLENVYHTDLKSEQNKRYLVRNFAEAGQDFSLYEDLKAVSQLNPNCWLFKLALQKFSSSWENVKMKRSSAKNPFAFDTVETEQIMGNGGFSGHGT